MRTSEKSLALVHEKLDHLRSARVLAVDPNMIFVLDKQIAELEGLLRDWSGNEFEAVVEDDPREPALKSAARPLTMPQATQVFVSYAWADGVTQVDTLCSTLAAQGLEVQRDSTHAEIGTRISAFMHRLAASDFILVVLSPSYLRSPNCMTELFEIYRGCGDEPERFLQRVIPLVQQGAAISKLGDRLAHAKYWVDQARELEVQVNELGAHNLGPQAMLEYRRIHEFGRHVAEMLSLVNDRLVPRDFDRMHAEGFKELLGLMGKA